jgi:ABC-type glycerol-3-phosphate transport system substrate-binding protein
MQRSITRSLAVATATAVALTLGACASGGGSDDGEDTGTIVVWDLLVGSDPNWKAVMDDVDAQFEEAHPGVEIDRVAQPADPTVIKQLMQAAAQARSGPDLIMIWAWGDVLSLKPSLVPIDEYISDEQRDSLKGWEGVMFDDATYGVPIGLQGLGVMYNRALYEQAGLDPDDPPTSVDEIADACAALNDAGILPIGGGNKEGYLSGWTYSTLFAGTATSEEAAALPEYETPFDAPPVSTAVDGVFDLVDADCFSPDMPATPWYPDGFEKFAAGQAAMQFTIYSQFGYMQDPNIGDDLSFIPSIENTIEPEFLPAGAMNVWAVTEFSEHRKLAAELALFQEEAQFQQQRLDTGSYFPNNKDVTFDAFLELNPGAAPLVDALQNGAQTFLPAHNMQDAKTNDIFQSQIELAMLGQTTVADALANAEASRKEQRSVLFGSE